ncbi:unnamed protein product [Camellia sinensis]
MGKLKDPRACEMVIPASHLDLFLSKERHLALISPECSSATYRWVVSCSAEATRSSMSPGSVHCSRACNLLGNATYYGFCKPLAFLIVFQMGVAIPTAKEAPSTNSLPLMGPKCVEVDLDVWGEGTVDAALLAIINLSVVLFCLYNFQYVIELIECILLAIKDYVSKAGDSQSPNVVGHTSGHAVAADAIQHESTPRKNSSSNNQGNDLMMSRSDNQKEIPLDASENLYSHLFGEEPTQSRPADWARILEAATQRRTEVRTPENLENMWTKGRNYKKKIKKVSAGGLQDPSAKGSASNNAEPTKNLGKEMSSHRSVISSTTEDKTVVQLSSGLHIETRPSDGKNKVVHLSHGLNKQQSFGGTRLVDELKATTSLTDIGNKGVLKRSNSTSALNIQSSMEKAFPSEGGGSIISEFYSPDFGRHDDIRNAKSVSDMVLRNEGVHTPKLRCRVIGAYFEKLGSNSFAVYSITVTDADENMCRYRNFERLHRHLKDIPNYTLHLPPKRILSSSTEDTFVHQRCIQLDKYLRDLLSIANVAEQHEVWDFLSASSKFIFSDENPGRWTPPNVSLPVLNLVDKMFQLKRKGWLRRQVFWISKQILQLMMEDAIDDWLLGQIQRLRRDDVTAQGIRWVQDIGSAKLIVLWPDGTFFLRLNSHTEIDDCEPHQRSFQTTRSRASKLGSFEQQLEAAHRASDIKKMIFNSCVNWIQGSWIGTQLTTCLVHSSDGAPTALVSLIGHKQYHRTARDLYYFLQSTICLKQLAYGILELVLVSVFPELRDLVLDIHQKLHTQPE